MGVLVQVIATVILCFTCMNMGITIAWPSSTLLLFKSENTTLHRPMTNMDITLLSCLPYLGAIVSQPFVTLVVLNKLDLKHTTILTSLVYVIGWSIISVTKQVEIILLSVVINGFGYINFVVVSMYISEIAQDSIRGTLTAGPNLGLNLGLLISYFLGGSLSYHLMVYTSLTLAVIGTLMITFLKEPPVRLLAKGKEEETMKSLAFYRQMSSSSKEIITDINNIRRSLNIHSSDVQYLTQVEKQDHIEMDTTKRSCWEAFQSTPAIRRQFYLASVLQFAFIYQGLPSVQIYAGPIFTATMNHSISADLCSVVLGLIVLITGIVAAYLTDLIGRRPLQLYSSIVCGVCCLFLGTQILTQWLPSWTILLFIVLFATSHNVGAGTVTFVVAAEIFSPEVKNQLLMIVNELAVISMFSCMFFISILVQSYGLSTMFFLFTIASFLSSVYFYYFLPETKGLPVYAIQALFNKKVVK